MTIAHVKKGDDKKPISSEQMKASSQSHCEEKTIKEEAKIKKNDLPKEISTKLENLSVTEKDLKDQTKLT